MKTINKLQPKIDENLKFEYKLKVFSFDIVYIFTTGVMHGAGWMDVSS